MTHLPIDRRSLFKGTGALVVSVSFSGGLPGGFAAAELGAAVKPQLAPDQLDSWLAIKSDGAVVAYFGKMDMGQGVDVAIAQIVAEELDVPLARVGVVMGDTALTVNQGGASGSTGVQKGGIALRNAAAEARRVLLELASAQLRVPADRLAVDESSVGDIPGVRVVRDKGFLGIVAEREWDAVQAAERLKVTWSEPPPPFPENAALYQHIRQAPVVKREVPVATGEIEPAFAGAMRVVEAEYEWPFQSHASMGPACAVVDAREDGATLWTGSQKPHFARDGVARALGLPQDKVHGIWAPGPGSYGRNDAGDAGIDAALLSKAVGRPARVQGMRHEGHGWGPQGPASIHPARAALDRDGAVIGYAFESKGFSRIDIDTNESDPSYSLAGQLMGLPLKSLQGFGAPPNPTALPTSRWPG